jgi:hypothetical protein
VTHLQTVYVLALLALVPAAASAQEREREPIAPFAADMRVTLPRYPSDQAIATTLGVTDENLPSRGLGLSFGAHVYPLRGKVALGVGAEVLMTRASKTLEGDEGAADGPTVKGRFNAFSPQISLNFGSRRGWSYVSGGIGWGTFTEEVETSPVASPDGRIRTLNYGGGARWFAKEHLAFTFDFRFHRFDAQEAGTGRPAYPKGKMTIISGGISVK